jgi:hypothetical protein
MSTGNEELIYLSCVSKCAERHVACVGSELLTMLVVSSSVSYIPNEEVRPRKVKGDRM